MDRNTMETRMAEVSTGDAATISRMVSEGNSAAAIHRKTGVPVRLINAFFEAERLNTIERVKTMATKPPANAKADLIREWMQRNWKTEWWGMMDCDRCPGGRGSKYRNDHPCDSCPRWLHWIGDYRKKNRKTEATRPMHSEIEKLEADIARQSQDIEEKQRQLQNLRASMDTPEKQLADIMHSAFGPRDDSWWYEIKDGYHDWTAHDHAEWLRRSGMVIRWFLNHGHSAQDAFDVIKLIRDK